MVKNGEIGYCACNVDMQPCSENEGDCDYNYHCQGGQRCRSNSCLSSLGYDSNTDCCQIANLGDEDFCTADEPCGVGEGQCDSNDDCRSNHLVCGSDNCPNSLGASSELDCCESRGNSFLLFFSINDG